MQSWPFLVSRNWLADKETLRTSSAATTKAQLWRSSFIELASKSPVTVPSAVKMGQEDLEHDRASAVKIVQEDLERDVVDHVAEDKQSKEAALRSEQAKRLSLEGSVQTLKEQMNLMQGQLVTAQQQQGTLHGGKRGRHKQ